MSEPADLDLMHLEELVSHYGWLTTLARRLVRDESAADDLVQDTWIAALRRPPSEGPLRPWLARVLTNAWRMSERGSRRRRTREEKTYAARVDVATDEVVAEAQRDAAGPPKFDAKKQLEMLRANLAIARDANQPLEELEKLANDPEYEAMLVQAEKNLLDNYRQGAHMRGPLEARGRDESDIERTEIEFDIVMREMLSRDSPAGQKRSAEADRLAEELERLKAEQRELDKRWQQEKEMVEEIQAKQAELDTVRSVDGAERDEEREQMLAEQLESLGYTNFGLEEEDR